MSNSSDSFGTQGLLSEPQMPPMPQMPTAVPAYIDPLVDRIEQYLRESSGTSHGLRAEKIVEIAFPRGQIEHPLSMAESNAQKSAEKMAGAISASLLCGGLPPWSGENFAARIAETLRPVPEAAKKLIEELDAAEAALVARAARIAELESELAGVHIGADSAVGLYKANIASAESREALAIYNYAGMKLQHAQMVERIAVAISRGHVQADFFQQLEGWSK